jgi:hypothetical protein
MMSDYPSTIIRNTRRIIANGIPEIQHLTKGDLPASFGLAADFARKIMEACTAAENALADHVQTPPAHPTGNDAWDAVSSEPVDDLINDLEAEVHFAELMASGIAERNAVAEAKQIDHSHPEIFAPILGILRGA